MGPEMGETEKYIWFDLCGLYTQSKNGYKITLEMTV